MAIADASAPPVPRSDKLGPGFDQANNKIYLRWDRFVMMAVLRSVTSLATEPFSETTKMTAANVELFLLDLPSHQH